MPRSTPDLIQLLREIADDYDDQGEPAPTDLLREAADRLQLLQDAAVAVIREFQDSRPHLSYQLPSISSACEGPCCR